MLSLGFASAVHEQSRSVGVGWIAKIDDTMVVHSGAEICTTTQQQAVVELTIIHKVLQEACRLGVKVVEVGVDVQPMVAWLQGQIPLFQSLQPLLLTSVA